MIPPPPDDTIRLPLDFPRRETVWDGPFDINGLNDFIGQTRETLTSEKRMHPTLALEIMEWFAAETGQTQLVAVGGQGIPITDTTIRLLDKQA